eukprot:1307607-Prymnesium_polylepis.1
MCASTQARRSTPGYSTRGRRKGLGEERDEPRTRATIVSKHLWTRPHAHDTHSVQNRGQSARAATQPHAGTQ